MSLFNPARHRARRRALAIPVVSAAVLACAAAVVPAAHAAPAGSAVPAVPAVPAKTAPLTLHRSPLTRAQIEQLTRHATNPVIVVLRDQSASTLGHGPSASGRRGAALARSQSHVVAELRKLKTSGLRQYRFLNAVAGTVSATEVARLRSDPSVLAVVPDRTVTLPAGAAGAAAPAAGSAASAAVNRTPGVCGTAKHPLVEPEALGRINALTAPHGVTGKGVKVAVFADGIDTAIRDYVRADGTHVIFDYKDFSGTGPRGVTGGGEAFGDVSSLAAQGRATYDLSKETNPSLPLPKGCDIKIKGVAPGARVAVMKVFGGESATESTILQGLEYAVTHDHVDVLSQSFGGASVPQDGQDPIAMFDAEAVRDGITVVVSSGDAGTTNTIGSPAADAAGAISVGATTAFRAHAQLSMHGYQLGHDKGWENDNIASLSSSGFTSAGPNTVDLVAPGDAGWANCSATVKIFSECANGFGAAKGAPAIEDFGGTSQAAPLVAGVAALVINAYRSTHHGATPSPWTVKQVLTSSARDLSAPVTLQGAGLVDAQRAVELARAYRTRTVATTGPQLTVSRAKIATTAAPGTSKKVTLVVHNHGAKAVTLHPALKHFGTPRSVLSGSVDYEPAKAGTPTFAYWLTGKPQPYAEKDFTVPGGYQRLQTRIGFPAGNLDAPNEAFLVIFDPKGRLAQDSDPQGAGSGFGQVEVRNPQPGKWRAIVFTRPSGPKTPAYAGQISVSATVQKLMKVGGSSIRAVTVGAHASANVGVSYALPANPGDSAQGVYFGSALGVVPVLLRATVPVSVTKPGTFRGTLTGGNGRPNLGSQFQDYTFHVPAGQKDLDVDVTAPDAAFDVVASLIAPGGKVVDSQTTDFLDMTSPFGAPTVNEPGVHLSWAHPVAGTWQLDLFTLSGDRSGKTSEPYTGTIAFNTVKVSSDDLPNSAKTVLDTGTVTTAHVTVTNTGNAPELYYLDPRLNTQTTYPLSFATYPNGTVGVDKAEIIVPPETQSAVVAAMANRPIQFSTSPVLSSPSVLSTTGKTAVVGLSDRPQASEWSCGPSLVGPFAAAAPTTKFSCAGLATTDTINDDMLTTGGNLWDMTTEANAPNSYFPLVSTIVQPGKSATLEVAISPSDNEITDTVTGYLAVQTLNLITFSSDELAHVPYKYTVAYGGSGS